MIGTTLASKHLSVSELCFTASGMAATAAIVEARSTGNPHIITSFTEKGWLAMRGHLDCNLMSPNRQILLASRTYATRLLDWADNVGAAGIVVSAGYCPVPNTDKERRLVSSLRSVSRRSMSGSDLLIENGSNRNTGSISSIRRAIDLADDDRFGIHLNVARAFAYGYTLDDICSIDKTHIRSVQISLPSNEMELGCGKTIVTSLEDCKWGPDDFQRLVDYFSELPIIVESTNQHDWALIESGAWASIAILRDDNLSRGDSKDNRLGQVESS